MIRVVLKDIVEKPITGEWGNEGTSVNVLRTTNFTNEGFIDYTKVVKRDIEQKKIDIKRLFKGDLIIEKSGGSPTQPVGRVVYFDSDEIFLCNNFTAILRPKKEQVFPKYLHYLLFVGHQFGQTSAFQNKTTGIINLQLTKYLDGIQIPLPPLPQQQKIANILDAADALRQNDKALVAKYDELTQSLFLDMFGDPVRNPKGWEKVKLKHFIYKLNTGVSVNSEETSDKKGQYFILKTSCVYSGIFNPNQVKTIREDEIQRAKLNPKKDSIIISRMNTSELVGKSAYIFEDYSNIFLPDRLWQTEKTNLEHSVLWLSHNIGHKSFMNEISKISSGTSGSMKNISKSSFLELKSINPPLKLQNQFAERVALIEEQKAIAQASLIKSEELFNSLLQKAFKGELV